MVWEERGRLRGSTSWKNRGAREGAGYPPDDSEMRRAERICVLSKSFPWKEYDGGREVTLEVEATE